MAWTIAGRVYGKLVPDQLNKRSGVALLDEDRIWVVAGALVIRGSVTLPVIAGRGDAIGRGGA